MNTYILLIYGAFDSIEDIEFFCMNTIDEIETFKNVRYVIDENKNIIVVFDATLNLTELNDILKNDSIKFYFLFERNDMISAFIPESIRNQIFTIPKNTYLKLQFNKEQNELLQLDVLLEKIQNTGIDSLTEIEKKYLNNLNLEK